MSNQIKGADFCQTPLKNAAFDSVLPSNPVYGQFYFDGTSLCMWNGTVWKYASDSTHAYPSTGGFVTGKVYVELDAVGTSYDNGQMELRCSAASGANVSLGFHRTGSNAVGLILKSDNILNLRDHEGHLSGFSAGGIWSNGAPVAESGSNSNGSWTKWSDGTMIQSGWRYQQGNSTARLGQAVWWPVKFYGDPTSVQVTGLGYKYTYAPTSPADCGGIYGEIWCFNVTNPDLNACTIYSNWNANTTPSAYYSFSWTAFGRWKA